MKLTKYIYLLILAVVLNSACVSLQVSPVSGNKRVYGYSWEQELEIGQEADGEIIAQYGLYDDPELAEYVDQLGQELLEVSHFNREDTPDEYRNTEFTFRVLNSPVVNAFALPGGYVYVTRGLLGHLDNEAQLMVVLGHEIGHVAARHASQRAAEQQLGQLAIIGGAVLGQSLGLDGGNILQLSSQTAQLLFLSYSRDDERESDQLGVEYSAMEGYEAAEGGEFFTSLKRISEKAGHSIPSHLSSHPDPGEREDNIPRLAAEWEEKGYDQTIVNKEKFMSMIDGLMYGANPREGFEEDGVFYHPELAFEFPVPDGFVVFNQPSAVILVNEAQDAVVQFTISSESDTPEDAVQAFLNQEGITTVDQEQINVNGYNGYTAEATTQTEDGTSLSIDLSAVEYNGNVYQFLSYTATSQFEDYRNRFESVFNGFEEVTDPDILNVEPVRLDLIRAERTAPFSELLPSNLPMDIEPLDIAIINQVQLDDIIQRGTVLKIPVQ
ncbi:MAG: M48 family metalloprotease [Balneolaceae bacterium]|nr:M48 family metalloprotease [Balneolaceae bacterium]MBO6547727.1 M48 family metalloprotease [Balneolaceae bacterium]MBO6648238.1 M48 family metalloprotease [Balneolaceae bacterium]